MRTQRLLWTALPNGFRAGGRRLRVSVLLSPRLVMLRRELLSRDPGGKALDGLTEAGTPEAKRVPGHRAAWYDADAGSR